MSKRDDRVTVSQMLQAAQMAQAFAVRVGPARALEDVAFQEAMLRQLEILGEASTRLNPSFVAARPEWPWRSMRALRNALIHGYDAIDMDDVWSTVQVDLPTLVTLLKSELATGDR